MVHYIIAWQTLFCVSDEGINVLLGMICYFMTVIHCICSVDQIAKLKNNFPSTVKKAKKMLGLRYRQVP